MAVEIVSWGPGWERSPLSVRALQSWWGPPWYAEELLQICWFFFRISGIIDRHQVEDGGNGFQTWRVAANTLNKQSRTAGNGSSSRLGVGHRANKFTHYKNRTLQNVAQASDWDGFMKRFRKKLINTTVLSFKHSLYTPGKLYVVSQWSVKPGLSL
jgi:hypothetical protein